MVGPAEVGRSPAPARDLLRRDDVRVGGQVAGGAGQGDLHVGDRLDRDRWRPLGRRPSAACRRRRRHARPTCGKWWSATVKLRGAAEDDGQDLPVAGLAGPGLAGRQPQQGEVQQPAGVERAACCGRRRREWCSGIGSPWSPFVECGAGRGSPGAGPAGDGGAGEGFQVEVVAPEGALVDADALGLVVDAVQEQRVRVRRAAGGVVVDQRAQDSRGRISVARRARPRRRGCPASSTRPQAAIAAAELSRSSPLPSPNSRSQ